MVHDRISGSIKVGVVGAGFISKYHVDGIRASKAAEVTLLVGRDAVRTAARAAELGIASHTTDYQAILEERTVDALVIATPDATHHKLAAAALDAGIPVLLQKPMAMTAYECEELLATARRTGTKLSVSFMHRYFPEIRWLKTLLDKNTLGQIDSIRIRNATAGADWAAWFYQPGSVAGGVAMQLGVHGIDLCQYLFGSIESVSAQTRIARSERALDDGSLVKNPFEDTVIASYRLQSGALVSHEMSYTDATGCDRFRLEVYAERGVVWLRTHLGPAALRAASMTGSADWTIPELPDESLGQVHHQTWIDTLTDNSTDDDTAAAGADSMRVVEALYRSAQSGRMSLLDDSRRRT